MNMQRKPSARLLLADDHRLLADACKKMLEPEYEVVAVETDGRSLVKSALTLKPDVIVLDIAMPHLNGLDAAQQIKQKLPSSKLVFLTMNQAPEVAAEAFRRGASAFVLKQSAADELVTAVRTVLRGESYLSPLVARETVNFLLHQAKPLREEAQITTRQSEILQLLAEGLSMKEIANELNLKPGTVAFHKYRMMETLGLKTNAQLLEYAIRRQMISR